MRHLDVKPCTVVDESNVTVMDYVMSRIGEAGRGEMTEQCLESCILFCSAFSASVDQELLPLVVIGEGS